jgi:nucleoid-associated protein YgaU
MHRTALRPWFVAAAGLLVLIGGAMAVHLRGGAWRNVAQMAATSDPARTAPHGTANPAESPPATAEEAQSPAETAARPPASAGTRLAARGAPFRRSGGFAKPVFDVVRVNAEGSAVMAGRAHPGAEVMIRDGDRELGHVKADDQGQWVFLPNAPLPPGSRELTLSERTSEGGEQRADAAVLLVVPERQPEQAANPPSPPLAVLAPDNPAAPGGARVLQPPPPAGIGAGARLGLDVVQYDDHGAIGFAGSAPPGAPVRLYIDNRKAGDAVADATGRWSLTPTLPIAAGKHSVRVDQLTPKGHVIARVELPFSRETVAEAAVANGHVIVQPGQNLWRLARRVYGSGLRYTVIYQANREQIRDPRMIYPGQTFAVPDAPATPEAPAKNG